jgi:hypothetical protein
MPSLCLIKIIVLSVMSVGVIHSISILPYAFEVVGTAGTTGIFPAMIASENAKFMKPTELRE